MKPKNISDFVTLSEIVNKKSSLVLKATKMNLNNNSYESSIWKFSRNEWIELKKSSNWNFSNPKYSNTKNSISFIKTPKSSDILDSLEKKGNSLTNKLVTRTGNQEKVIFETEDTISNYIWSEKDEFIYVITKEWSSDYKNIKSSAEK